MAHLLSVILNLIASAIGGIAVWFYQKLKMKKLRKARLQRLLESAGDEDIAICIRVGGKGDPLPDVKKYLREKLTQIHQLLIYNLDSSGEDLDDPKTALRIIEDINEGINIYGKGETKRVHFFPSGMVAYPFVLGALIGTWGIVIVYHKTGSGYAPLYEVEKKRLQSSNRDSQPLKAWEVIDIEAKPLIVQI